MAGVENTDGFECRFWDWTTGIVGFTLVSLYISLLVIVDDSRMGVATYVAVVEPVCLHCECEFV